MDAPAGSEHIASKNTESNLQDGVHTKKLPNVLDKENKNSDRFAALSFPDPPPLVNNRSPRRRAKGNKFNLLLICFSVLPLLLGCDDYQRQRTLDLEKQRDDAHQKSQTLKKQIEQLTTESTRDKSQIKSLQNLGDKRLDLLFHVVKIDIDRHSGGVDVDGKPGHDVVRVFLSPRDQDGSAIKAAGDVKIALHDLAAPEGKTLIAEYEFPVDEISKHWASGFMTYHYSFDCKLPAPPPTGDKITIHVTFIDYLTGKTFTAQKPVTILLPQGHK